MGGIPLRLVALFVVVVAVTLLGFSLVTWKWLEADRQRALVQKQKEAA